MYPILVIKLIAIGFNSVEMIDAAETSYMKAFSGLRKNSEIR